MNKKAQEDQTLIWRILLSVAVGVIIYLILTYVVN